MSIRANIDIIASASGVSGVLVEVDGADRTIRGDARWEPVLHGSIGILRLTDEESIRVIVGEHTLAIHRAESGELVAVACPTGHAIAKSLRRMIRRLARKERPKAARAAAVDGGPLPHDPPRVAGLDDCEGP